MPLDRIQRRLPCSVCFCFFPHSLPTVHCFIPVRCWLISPVPLLPASCDLLSIGEGIVEELCRSSAASRTTSLPSICIKSTSETQARIDSVSVCSLIGLGPPDLVQAKSGNLWFFYFFIYLDAAAFWSRRDAAGNRTWEGVEWCCSRWLVIMGKRLPDPSVCQHNIQSEEEIFFYGGPRLFYFSLVFIVSVCSGRIVNV